MSDKPKRTLQDVQTDIAQIAQKVGVLVYQMERELPREIEKHYNQLFDLDGEGQKLFKAQQQEQFEKQEAAKALPNSPENIQAAIDETAAVAEHEASKPVLQVVP